MKRDVADRLSAVVASVPANSTAGRVMARGTHFNHAFKNPSPDAIRASELPLPTKMPSDVNGQTLLASMQGRLFGRLRVIGYAKHQPVGKHSRAAWVVKCSCGRYELRNTRAIHRAPTTGDGCAECRRMESLKRSYKELGSKPLEAFTQSTTENAQETSHISRVSATISTEASGSQEARRPVYNDGAGGAMSARLAASSPSEVSTSGTVLPSVSKARGGHEP